ncbi:MAG: hypothetical protein Kow0080_16890 [Candidatus Promineifilaceae bacterium]
MYVAGFILLLILLALLMVWLSPNQPPGPTTIPAAQLNDQPLLVTFSELNANPQNFQNQRIRVNGSLNKLPPPSCLPFMGPIIRWALASDNLQMNALGYETLIRLAPAGLPMTVEGIWRLYDGPAGCEGEAEEGASVWYLEVERIVQPNPFPPGTAVPHAGTPVLSPANATTTLPAPTTPGIFPAESTSTPFLSQTATATSTAMPTISVGVTAVTVTPSETPLSTVTPVTAVTTPTRTPTPEATLLPGQPSPTPTSTPTPSFGSSPPQPTPTGAGFITSTPNPGPGYPGMPPTPTVPGGYP